MSLTIFVHEKQPVVVVRWFLDSRGLMLYARGPYLELPLAEFRLSGFEWIKNHFADFAHTRVDPSRKLPVVFQSGEAKRLLRGRRVLQIDLNANKDMVIIPKIIERYSLDGLSRVKPKTERIVGFDEPASKFWEAFDGVLALAPTDS